MKRSAFTMIELVFVIVVLGILAALAVPRMERDHKQEASDAILSNIRYTQHLALLDNKQKFDDDEWQRTFWQIKFESCGSGSGMFFSIGSDENKAGDLDRDETALDPANGKPMFWQNTANCSNGGDSTVSSNIFLTKKYGVDSISSNGGCSGQYIGFDHLGRPHVVFSSSDIPDNSSYMSQTCTFTFALKTGGSFSIQIEPETGYAHIVGQEDS